MGKEKAARDEGRVATVKGEWREAMLERRNPQGNPEQLLEVSERKFEGHLAFSEGKEQCT